MSDKVILSGKLKYIHRVQQEIRQLELNDVPLFHQLDQLCVGRYGGWLDSEVAFGNVRITIERLEESD